MVRERFNNKGMNMEMKELFQDVVTDESTEGKLMGLVDDLYVTEYDNLSDDGKNNLEQLHNLILNMFINKGTK